MFPSLSIMFQSDLSEVIGKKQTYQGLSADAQQQMYPLYVFEK